MSEDFYDVLGVSRDASEEEIERAYREKASSYHPDVSDDPEAEEKFKKIKKAKEVLTDEQKRSAYDRMGHEQFTQAEKRGGFDGGPGGAGAGGRAGGRGDPFGGQDPFGAGSPFGDVGDIFEQFFGGSRRQGGGQRQRQRQRSRQRQGPDLQTRLEVDLEEVYEGVTKQITVTRPERCPNCDGSGHPPSAEARTCSKCDGRGQVTQVRQSALGRVQQTRPCRRCEGDGTLYSETCGTCGGDGVVQEEATLQVEIPAGIEDGQTLRMDGEGAPGENGGPKGDLLIEIGIRDHDEFERDGDDLHYRLPISFPQATFGDTVEVPTLEGTVELSIPAGTQSGETLRLKNKGMPRLRGRGHGDMYVQLQVVVPERLSEEQRAALEAFADAGGEEIDVDQGFFERIRSSF